MKGSLVSISVGLKLGRSLYSSPEDSEQINPFMFAYGHMQVYTQLYNTSYQFWGGSTTLNYTSPVRPTLAMLANPANVSFADGEQFRSYIDRPYLSALQVLHTTVLTNLQPDTK